MNIGEGEALEVLIPSRDVRAYIRETGRTLTDMQKAALLYRGDLPLRERDSRLWALREKTDDVGLKKQLVEYLTRKERVFEGFKENEDKHCIYVLLIEQVAGLTLYHSNRITPFHSYIFYQ